MLAIPVDSHKHKLKQLVDDDGTPNTDKNTVFKGYIVSKKSLLFVQGRVGGAGNYLKDIFEELVGNE